MPLGNAAFRYGAVAIALHWLTALAIAVLLALGLVMTEVDGFQLKIALYQWHKSLGLTVLALVLLRLAWRLANRPPRLPDSIKAYQRGLAGATHWALYALLLAMPLSGWVMASASSLPTEFFGWFDVPRLVAIDRTIEGRAGDVHEILAWVLVGLLALHVAAALKHHFVDRDDVLRRILPARSSR